MALSPNQVLTHTARAAAKQLRRLWWPRAARAKGSGQSNVGRSLIHPLRTKVGNTAHRRSFYKLCDLNDFDEDPVLMNTDPVLLNTEWG